MNQLKHFLVLVLSIFKLLICLEETWTADEQCKLAYGEQATFCQSFSNIICSSLQCRLNSSSLFCENPRDLEALSGTVCESGKSCLSGICIEDPEARQGDCLYGDGQVVNEFDLGDTIFLPETTVNCTEAIKYIIQDGYDPISFCYSKSYTFAEKCCLTCQKIMSGCIDQVVACSRYASNCESRLKINGVAIGRACEFTCSNCKRTPLYCLDSTSMCKNGGTCQNRTQGETSLSNLLPHIIKYECLCPVGWIGELCERRDPCLLSPCQNNGTCQVTDTFFFCKCPPNTLGKLCEINIETTTITSTVSVTTTLPTSTTIITAITTKPEIITAIFETSFSDFVPFITLSFSSTLTSFIKGTIETTLQIVQTKTSRVEKPTTFTIPTNPTNGSSSTDTSTTTFPIITPTNTTVTPDTFKSSIILTIITSFNPITTTTKTSTTLEGSTTTSSTLTSSTSTTTELPTSGTTISTSTTTATTTLKRFTFPTTTQRTTQRTTLNCDFWFL